MTNRTRSKKIKTLLKEQKSHLGVINRFYQIFYTYKDEGVDGLVVVNNLNIDSTYRITTEVKHDGSQHAMFYDFIHYGTDYDWSLEQAHFCIEWALSNISPYIENENILAIGTSKGSPIKDYTLAERLDSKRSNVNYLYLGDRKVAAKTVEGDTIKKWLNVKGILFRTAMTYKDLVIVFRVLNWLLKNDYSETKYDQSYQE
jgi:hypothetical protein